MGLNASEDCIVDDMRVVVATDMGTDLEVLSPCDRNMLADSHTGLDKIDSGGGILADDRNLYSEVHRAWDDR